MEAAEEYCLNKGVIVKNVFLTLILAMLGAALISAQDVKPVDIYLGGGLSLPNSPDVFKDNWKTGYHGLAGVGFKTFPSFSIVGLAEYHTFGLDTSGVDGGAYNVMMFTFNGRLALGVPTAPMKPFVIGGIGLANVKIGDIETAGYTSPFSISKTVACFAIGGGLEFKAGPAAAIFIQGRYIVVSTEGKSTTIIPISVGLKF